MPIFSSATSHLVNTKKLILTPCYMNGGDDEFLQKYNIIHFLFLSSLKGHDPSVKGTPSNMLYYF